MIKVQSDADKVCVAKANEAGQGHIFDGWDDLSADEQRALIQQIEGIDFQVVKRLVQEHLQSPDGCHEGSVLKPAPVTRLHSGEACREELGLCKTLGEYAIRNEEVVLVTAAGEGAFPEPVGMVPVGPVSGKSLFQLHAEKIHATNRRYRVSLRWLIFCHPDEKERITGHFRSNGYFGLKCSDITFIAQDLLPVIDRRGRVLLSGRGRIAMSPNGHGGILIQAMEEERLKLLEAQGARHIFYFQIDNPLVRIADPIFLGHHIKNQAEVSTKAVRKVDPEERVGVICLLGGLLSVVEHTEIGEEDRRARLPDGSLVLSAANTGMHVFSIEFLRKLREEAFQPPYHAVERVTPYLGKRGKLVRPVKPNSVRFKAFIFDAIRKASRASIVEVERADEFSPIKNPSGPNSPETARRDLSRLYARWLRAAHAEIPGAAGTDSGPAVEVSPLYALDLEELIEKIEVPVGAGAPHNGFKGGGPAASGADPTGAPPHGGILLGGA